MGVDGSKTTWIGLVELRPGRTGPPLPGGAVGAFAVVAAAAADREEFAARGRRAARDRRLRVVDVTCAGPGEYPDAPVLDGEVAMGPLHPWSGP